MKPAWPSWGRLAAFLVVLNFFDAAMTLSAIDRGAVEMSPLIRAFLLEHPNRFALAKIAWSLGLAVALLLLHRRGSRLARPGLWGCVWFYLGVAGYHVSLAFR